MNLGDNYITEIRKNKKKISEYMQKMKLNSDIEFNDEAMTELVMISGYFELILKKLNGNKKLTECECKKSEDMISRINTLIIKK
ncbi:MAG: hypothetical protein KDD00_13125 [Ignavibacteriae bacterium]|nr:hypothetical protein [Ignavibacteriota bacterium]